MGASAGWPGSGGSSGSGQPPPPPPPPPDNESSRQDGEGPTATTTAGPVASLSTTVPNDPVELYTIPEELE
eukprot:5279275-Pyramimonas_sp.AAC.1